MATEVASGERTAEQANDLRAAVLGFNDGLVANLGLVMALRGPPSRITPWSSPGSRA
jgi:hypothetical protein